MDKAMALKINYGTIEWPIGSDENQDEERKVTIKFRYRGSTNRTTPIDFNQTILKWN